MKKIISGEELIRQSVEKPERKIKRSKKLKAKIRAEELAMRIDNKVIDLVEWNNFKAWYQKVVRGEEIVLPSHPKDFKPTVVRVTTDGRRICFEDKVSFILFVVGCYLWGRKSLFANIKAAYERGKVKTVEDVLESVQKSNDALIEKYMAGLELQKKIRFAINRKFNLTLKPEDFPTTADSDKDKMRKYIRANWRKFDKRRDRVEIALKEIFKGRKAKSKARTYSETDYH